MLKDYGQSDLKGNIIQAALLVFGLALLCIGMSLISGCSQEMGSRYELEWLDAGPKVTVTEFKFNVLLYDRDWKNFNYGGLSFGELDGKSKSVDVDLLRQKGSIK